MASKPTYRLPVADYPYVLVRLFCWDCPRRRNYRLARLAARYGAEITIADLLERIVLDEFACERWPKDGHPFPMEFCGAFFPNLGTDDPPGLPPQQLMLRVVE